MDLNLDSNATASDDWRTIAIRDAMEAETSITTYPASQDVGRARAPVDVLSTDTKGIDDISAPNLLQAGDMLPEAGHTYEGAFYDAAGLTGRGQADPSLQTLANELNGFQSEDEVVYEDWGVGLYEGLPNDGILYRKVKKHAAMSAEQQQTRMLQIEAQLRKFDDYEQATHPTEARTNSSQQSPVGKISEIPETSSLRADSPVSHLSLAQAVPAKNCLKRKGSKSSRARERRERKQQKKEIKPETLNVLSILFELGKPFEEKMHIIVEYARIESINKVRQDDINIPLEELQTMEAKWKDEHAAKLDQMTAFLERFGLIPFGGVEATGLGRDTLA